MLFVYIYDDDLLTPPDSMGQVIYPLSAIPHTQELDIWLPVLPKTPHEKIRGEIRLRLAYEYTKVFYATVLV